jgi:UDP-N-acetylglucosamine--N-acetylmuramyl-(pentapeptide) pyrophosphoryl-undecaprenol N-acetylglucosamine transferase
MSIEKRYILSGGGTGGHIFPAIAIADELKKRDPSCKILFVGAQDRMEMEKVPAAGYEIKGLWISGLQRSLKPKNLLFPIKLLCSIWKSKKIIRQFQPNAVIGTGGYASAAVLYAATGKGIPTLIQEQNNYAGLTNKWLSKKVNKICVSYDRMERFFPLEKLIKTGNPVRNQFLEVKQKSAQEKAKKSYGINANEKSVLVVGGSLGARSINHAIAHDYKKLEDAGIHLVWQTGKLFIEESAKLKSEFIKPETFISNMKEAYEMADVVISRAGAIAISEICIMGKPSVLIPLSTAAEDHQTKNAMALVNNDAAILVQDNEVKSLLIDTVITLLNDQEKQDQMTKNVSEMGLPNATIEIVNEIEKLI